MNCTGTCKVGGRSSNPSYFEKQLQGRLAGSDKESRPRQGEGHTNKHHDPSL